MRLTLRRPARPEELPEGSCIVRGNEAGAAFRKTVGLDIGCACLKAVEMVWDGHKARINGWAVVPVKTGWISPEGVLVAPSQVGALIGATLRHLGTRERRVIGALGGAAVLTRMLMMPRLPERHMGQAIAYEAALQLPVSATDMTFEYDLVSGNDTVDGDMTVFVAGTRVDTIRRYLECLKAGGLRGDALELDQLALYRALRQWSQSSPGADEATVVIDIGESGTRMAAFRNGLPAWSRTLGPGLGRVRSLLLAAGIPASSPSAPLALTMADRRAATALRPWYEAVTQGMHASLDFFLIQSRGAVLKDIFLVGGGACIREMADWFRAQLADMTGSQRPPTATVPGWGDLVDCPQEGQWHAPALMVAVGCALREQASP